MQPVGLTRCRRAGSSRRARPSGCRQPGSPAACAGARPRPLQQRGTSWEARLSTRHGSAQHPAIQPPCPGGCALHAARRLLRPPASRHTAPRYFSPACRAPSTAGTIPPATPPRAPLTCNCAVCLVHLNGEIVWNGAVEPLGRVHGVLDAAGRSGLGEEVDMADRPGGSSAEGVPAQPRSMLCTASGATANPLPQADRPRVHTTHKSRTGSSSVVTTLTASEVLPAQN